mgnify:CR=1 FL=1
MSPESVDVTAGLGGFLAFFLLAVALYFLMRNMNTRLRRLDYREEQQRKAVGTAGNRDPDLIGRGQQLVEHGPEALDLSLGQSLWLRLNGAFGHDQQCASSLPASSSFLRSGRIFAP